jgi:hypothetical protein
MRLLGLFAAIALVACVGATDPNRSRYCFYAGDTSGYGPLMQAKDSIIVACIFVVEPEKKCFDFVVKRTTRSDCIEGTKWKG